jgi:hypothetical protein
MEEKLKAESLVPKFELKIVLNNGTYFRTSPNQQTNEAIKTRALVEWRF